MAPTGRHLLLTWGIGLGVVREEALANSLNGAFVVRAIPPLMQEEVNEVAWLARSGAVPEIAAGSNAKAISRHMDACVREDIVISRPSPEIEELSFRGDFFHFGDGEASWASTFDSGFGANEGWQFGRRRHSEIKIKRERGIPEFTGDHRGHIFRLSVATVPPQGTERVTFDISPDIIGSGVPVREKIRDKNERRVANNQGSFGVVTPDSHVVQLHTEQDRLKNRDNNYAQREATEPPRIVRDPLRFESNFPVDYRFLAALIFLACGLACGVIGGFFIASGNQSLGGCLIAFAIMGGDGYWIIWQL
jgi:hypothetical protein